VRKAVRDSASVQRPRSCGTSLKDALLNIDKPLYINYSNPSEFTHEEPPMELFREYAEIHASTPTTMGDPGFMELYGVDYPLYTGAMAKGIASADLVIALGKRKILGSLGAGGLPLHLVNEALDKIQAELPNGPYAVNLIHSPFDVSLERGNVDLFLKRGVTIAEASAFMSLTEHVVRYRVAGLSMKNGKIHKKNKIIAKCSRTELAEMFMRPAPDKFLKKLLAKGEITAEQAKLAKLVPMSDDIAVESDSGGHTDNRPIHVILPLIMALRDRLQKELKYPTPVRVGVGGGIGCPAAMAAAFQMGAAFIITGSVNQIARQSGSSDIVRKELAKAAYSDVTMAPAADMFDQGVKLQVLKKGTMFASRAHKLWDLFCKYNSLDEIPQKDRERLEKKTFKQSIDAVWKETTNFYINRLHDEEKIKRAQNDPKLKMSLCFRWYLSKSSGWANRGEKDRKLDFQVWCGPAMGAYNDFVKGTYLDPHVTGVYPDAVQINLQLLTGCSFINRIQQIRSHPKLRNGVLNVDEISTYVPTKEL
jgi:PfaD family protein